MNLKVNNNHKKADISNLKSKKRVSLGLATIILSISLFSGCNISVEKRVHIPNDFKTQVEFYINDDITENNLKDLKELSLNINKDKDLKWLNKCENLEKLTLNYNSDFISLKDVINLPNLKELKINSLNFVGIFNEDNFPFLKNNNYKLEKLDLNNIEVDIDFLENLNKLQYISLDKHIFNKKINFWKFDNLSVVDFKNYGIYNIAMFLDDIDCYELFKKDVAIIANNGLNVTNELKSIDEKIDSLLEKSEINVADNDIEKLNAILSIVLNELTYDPDFKDYQKELENEVHDFKDYQKELANVVHDLYYKNGYLYGALNRLSGHSICGNFAALFQTLATRLELESYFITSKTHAYNLVNIDDKYMYTDPTYLDDEVYHKPVYSDSEKLTEDIKLLSGYDVYTAVDAINKGYGYELNWYLEEPNQYHDESHVSVNIPSHIQIERFDNKNGQEKQYLAKIGKNSFLLNYIGLISFVLMLAKINNKNNKNINRNNIKKR